MYKKALCIFFIAAAVLSFGDSVEAKKKYLDPNGNLTTRRKAEARWDKENIRREKRDMKYQERRNREIYHIGNDYQRVDNYSPYYDYGGDYYEGYDYDRMPFNPDSEVQSRLRGSGRRNDKAAQPYNTSAASSRSGLAAPYKGAPRSNAGGVNPSVRNGGAARSAYRTNTRDKVAAARKEIESADIPDDKREFVNRIQAGLNSSDRMEQHRALAEWNSYRQRLGVFNR